MKPGVIRSGLAFVRAWLAAVVVLLVPSTGLAQVDIAIPSGWAEAAPGSPAAARARAWAEASAEVRTVLATTIEDDFAETLAVLAVARPLDPDALTDPARARERLTAEGATLIGADAPPDEVDLVAVDAGATAIVGRWEGDALVMRIALVPEGSTHAAIVLAVPKRMDPLYAGVLDEVLASARGAVVPPRPFPRARWLAIAWLGWLVAAIAGVVLLVRSTRASPGPSETARRVAIAAAGAAAIVAVVVSIATASADAELEAAGISAMWLVVQVASGGLVVAAAVLVTARFLEQRVRPIQSAPGEGTYGAWTRAPSGPRAVVPVAGASTPAPSVAPAPIPIAAPHEEGFPAPGRAMRAELRLAPSDEPAAHLEHVGGPPPPDDEDDELANLTTAEIRLDGKGDHGGRFRPR